MTSNFTFRNPYFTLLSFLAPIGHMHPFFHLKYLKRERKINKNSPTENGYSGNDMTKNILHPSVSNYLSILIYLKRIKKILFIIFSIK